MAQNHRDSDFYFEGYLCNRRHRVATFWKTTITIPGYLPLDQSLRKQPQDQLLIKPSNLMSEGTCILLEFCSYFILEFLNKTLKQCCTITRQACSSFTKVHLLQIIYQPAFHLKYLKVIYMDKKVVLQYFSKNSYLSL